jgi:selenocysteine lyase/cysteine desulfurase
MEQSGSFPNWTRRNFMSVLAGTPFVLQSRNVYGADADKAITFPARSEFELKGTYLNAAFTHPMSKGSHREVTRFLNERLMNRRNPQGYDGFDRRDAQNAFAKLINATAEEIAWVPSTMFGENMIVSGLELARTGAHVITDAFHFQGSLHMYKQLEKKGLKLSIIQPKENRIEIEQIEKAITPNTRLIAVSLVSATTGFQHDLKKLCAMAHANGVLVYADIIQAAGAVPIDVRDSEVDFCSTATYKWRMGDFGIGFLYVRKDRLPLLERTFYGYRQIKSSATHFLPFDTPGADVFESEPKEDMSGHFEVGTFANEGIVALRYSLDFLNRAGVNKITEYRMPMIQALQRELPKNGFMPLTPEGSTSPIVCFALKDAYKKIKPILDQADVNIQVYEHYIRISPSFYNDMNDVDKLVEVLRRN